MTSETIVAVYDTPKAADAAVHDLERRGVPADAISLHRKDDTGHGVTPPPVQHFLPRMFGYEPTPRDEDAQLTYERSLAEGASVVVVRGQQQAKFDVVEILERHRPMELDGPEGRTKVRRHVAKVE
jgi:hypothetical protein